MPIKHKFVSTVPDDPDTSIVRPSNWNDDHDLTGPASIRRVGLTMDGGGIGIFPGFKGSTPKLGYDGTIVGWEIVETSGSPGSIVVEVDKASASIPDPSTDKISASAPIQLSSASLASGGPTDLVGWNTAVLATDCLGFNVVSASMVQRVTLYLSIQMDNA